MKKIGYKIILALAAYILGMAPLQAAQQERWAVYYGASLPPSAFAAYDLVVFDREQHPDLDALSGKTRLGYLSLGEAEAYRPDFQDVQALGVLLEVNPAWNDHHVIDIRRSEWREYILDTVMPALLARGFDGVMLDTIDSPLHLETTRPSEFPGMREAAAELIRAIRARYPQAKIMLNRGFEILPQVAPAIDMVMAETIYTDWQPGKKNPVIQPPAQYRAALSQLAQAQKLSPGLKIYSLDYWPPKDKHRVRAIYAKQRSAGLIPYVSTLSLQTVHPEPK